MPTKYGTTPNNHIMEYKLDNALQQWYHYHLHHSIDNNDSRAILIEKLQQVLNVPHKPNMQRRYIQANIPLMPYDFNKTFHEIDTDLDILYQQLGHLANTIIAYFNYAQTNKRFLRQKLRQLSYMVNEFHLLAGQHYDNVVYITDNFTNTQLVDTKLSGSHVAQVLTDEGIVTLGLNNSHNVSDTASIYTFNGNGQAGNYHIISPDILEDDTETLPKNMFYLSTEDAHDDINAILDNQPETWFEYQMLNFPQSIKDQYPQYDFGWAHGKMQGDTLRLHIIIKLPEVQYINWIHLIPYLPSRYATGHISIYRLATSVDGDRYLPVYHHKPILHQDIDLLIIADPMLTDTPHDIRDLADSKMAGQGVWHFPTRQAQYIEIVLDQDEAFTENIGIERYDIVQQTTDHSKHQISPRQVHKEIQDGLPGEYEVSEDVSISKDIDIVEGWRYCIGIRDINIYNRDFKNTSTFTSVAHELNREIRAISIQVNEHIPDEFIDIPDDHNSWIQYYISFNDIDWHPISPIHHRELYGHRIPPKIYILNEHYRQDPTMAHGYLKTDGTPNRVRLKAVMARPSHLETYTPILENYTIRCVLKE